MLNTVTKNINGVLVIVTKASALDIPARSIVNAANKGLNMGGGICGAIYNAAGPSNLENYVKSAFPRGIQTGQSIVTPSFAMPNHKAIVHTVGPRYEDGTQMEQHYLTMAYSSAIEAAAASGPDVVFCGLSTGIYGYPLEEAAWIGINTVLSHLYGMASNMQKVTFALFKQEEYEAFANALTDCQFG